MSATPCGTFGCFPRVRGDVPHGSPLMTSNFSFSPRARGCSAASHRLWVAKNVFPACAGMFRLAGRVSSGVSCFPRVRGDVPTERTPSCLSKSFSPRARGCSVMVGYQTAAAVVFPACAGMFPPATTRTSCAQRFPRVRGDVPCKFSRTKIGLRFSPRARGCSSSGDNGVQIGGVFPACAGMFRFKVQG